MRDRCLVICWGKFLLKLVFEMILISIQLDSYKRKLLSHNFSDKFAYQTNNRKQFP